MQIFRGRPPPQRVGPLSLRDTKALANLFASIAGLWTPSSVPNAPMAPMVHAGRGGPRQNMNQRPAQSNHTNIYKPPFENTAIVQIDIPFTGDGFHLRKR